MLNDYNVPVIYDHRISRTVNVGCEVKSFFDMAPFDENDVCARSRKKR